jgi:AcrR family transcriptional regulator
MTGGEGGGEPAADDIPLYLRLLWHGEDGDRPGPKRGVDLRTIGAAAVRIADAEGIAAVTMRKLAADLGFTTMALYRYVQSKRELLMLVVDAAFEALPVTNGSSGWRREIADWALASREVLLAHPWILQVPFSEPPLTPNQIGWMERGLEALAETGLAEQEKLSSMLLVDVYVRGQTQLTVGVGVEAQPTEDDLRYARRLRALADPAQFPRITSALAAGALDDEDTEFVIDEFTFGLETVLDGIAARMSRRG